MIAALDIRSALQEDFAPLCALYCQSVKCYPDGFIQDLTFHGCLIEKSHRWREGRGDIAVALLHEKVVGLGGLAPCGENRVELCKLHVSPDCQGLGIGRALTEHLIAQARMAGFDEIELHVTATQIAALALYRRLGFVETQRAPFKTTVFGAEVLFDTIYMTLPLQNEPRRENAA